MFLNCLQLKPQCIIAEKSDGKLSVGLGATIERSITDRRKSSEFIQDVDSRYSWTSIYDQLTFVSVFYGLKKLLISDL